MQKAELLAFFKDQLPLQATLGQFELVFDQSPDELSMNKVVLFKCFAKLQSIIAHFITTAIEEPLNQASIELCINLYRENYQTQIAQLNTLTNTARATPQCAIKALPMLPPDLTISIEPPSLPIDDLDLSIFLDLENSYTDKDLGIGVDMDMDMDMDDPLLFADLTVQNNANNPASAPLFPSNVSTIIDQTTTSPILTAPSHHSPKLFSPKSTIDLTTKSDHKIDLQKKGSTLSSDALITPSLPAFFTDRLRKPSIRKKTDSTYLPPMKRKATNHDAEGNIKKHPKQSTGKSSSKNQSKRLKQQRLNRKLAYEQKYPTEKPEELLIANQQLRLETAQLREQLTSLKQEVRATIETDDLKQTRYAFK